MRDPFEWIDNLVPKLNLLRNYTYTRKVAFIFSTIMIGVWFLLGFDSGMGIIEQLVKLLPNLILGKISFPDYITSAYVSYGASFHLSSFVIYGYLFCATSYWLQHSLGVERSKNMVFSFNLTLLNISVFEHWWMASSAHFQESVPLLEWYVRDFWFLRLYLGLLLMGLYTVFYMWVDGLTLNENNEIIDKKYRFCRNKKMFLAIGLCCAGILFWYFYPGYVETVTVGNWTNSRLFPQTNYRLAYVPNNFIHLTNILVKAMFAITQFFILAGFKRKGKRRRRKK